MPASTAPGLKKMPVQIVLFRAPSPPSISKGTVPPLQEGLDAAQLHFFSWLQNNLSPTWKGQEVKHSSLQQHSSERRLRDTSIYSSTWTTHLITTKGIFLFYKAHCTSSLHKWRTLGRTLNFLLKRSLVVYFMGSNRAGTRPEPIAVSLWLWSNLSQVSAQAEVSWYKCY